ncbi:RICIN domain-containing protein [Pseudosporangium ferrugineum]|uniref:RICIN domain-containing protein n=1 Tax=Pseudosporangium ferrugineum TaxID=439699 RepID=UPI001304A5A1|nr:RICIN domain-containing protein [Pseudosporangium ferrugineum]
MKSIIRAVAVLAVTIALSVTTITTVSASSTPATPKAAADYARLINKGSEKCMNIPGGSTAPGVGVTQFTCGSWNDHYWYFDELDTGVYWIRNRGTGLCLSVASQSRGEQLAQRPCTQLEARAWRFNIASDGRFQMINYSTGMCIGVAGGSKLDNAAVIQWPCGSWADHWWGYVA